MSSGDLAIFLIVGLLAHGCGDYVLQSDWMANEKTKRWWPALAHGAMYSVPFIALVVFPPWVRGNLLAGLGALTVVGGTHAVLDRFRLARHVIFAKERLLSPPRYWRPWSECSKTGYGPDKPEWLAIMLLIVTDNLIHISINTLVIIWAVKYA